MGFWSFDRRIVEPGMKPWGYKHGQKGTTYALSFDGMDDYVEIPGMENLGDAGTLELFVTLDSTDDGILFGHPSSGADDRLQFAIDEGVFTLAITEKNYTEISTEYSPVTGVLYKLGLSWDADSFWFYVDGEQEHSGTYTGNIVTNNSSWYIGCNSPDSLISSISVREARIWGVRRTETEISNSLDANIDPNETGLVALYLINEGSGTTLTDQTDNGYDGTINGATWVEI